MPMMSSSASSTSPVPDRISETCLSATAIIASSRRRYRSVRQSLASSTDARVSGSPIRSSDPGGLDGPLATGLAGVRHAARLDQQQFYFMFREGLVLDPLRHDEHLAGREEDGAVAEIDPQLALQHDKGFVGVL